MAWWFTKMPPMTPPQKLDCPYLNTRGPILHAEELEVPPPVKRIRTGGEERREERRGEGETLSASDTREPLLA